MGFSDVADQASRVVILQAPISVLIADDQDLVREGLRMPLEAEPDLAIAGEAGDGSQALAQARLLDPDVILMNVRMPGRVRLPRAEGPTRAASCSRTPAAAGAGAHRT
jgi:DNA-binding NarL/FixJ family response regulator